MCCFVYRRGLEENGDAHLEYGNMKEYSEKYLDPEYELTEKNGYIRVNILNERYDTKNRRIIKLDLRKD